MPMSLTSASVPLNAAAAAIWGDIKCVRPPCPCRPSKLRFEVDAHRSPGSSLSGFMARHMEQPGSLQSKPASMRILSSPSRTACSLTSPLPGTTMACTPLATLLPLQRAATTRRSSMRPLVQEPMKTFWMGTSVSFCPAVRPMYSSERSMPARRWGSFSSAGSGTEAVMGATSWGEVPQVTVGAMSDALILTSVSYLAPSSLLSVRQYFIAFSSSAPLGARGRPLMYSKVTSSGAIMPARAPASMAMLQMLMRASIERLEMASPQNSMTLPVPPAVPMTPMMCRMTSLEVTPGASLPDTSIFMFLARFCSSVCVASTCSTSDVPMPKASEPKAPWVAV
mmetsp:Transcript_35112/g.68835  ORF Transcript_35112/g.68835 Transcript_35112/m.68835 type:complete len:338 (-) Transcript_35112:692-1705(-)